MTMLNKIIKEFQQNGHKIRMEMGEIARQTNGAVLLDIDDAVVFATVVGAKNPKLGQDFFLLIVDYLGKTYTAGKILGGSSEREGRPSENETLTSCPIDRPLHPLFSEGFYNEVQVMIHVLSMNPEMPADIPALVAASAALAVSSLPFNGLVSIVRAGYKDGQYPLNPNRAQPAHSDLDLAAADTERAVLMVESEAQQLSGKIMLSAVAYGHEQVQITTNATHGLVRGGGRPEWDWQAVPKSEALVARVSELDLADLQAAYQLYQKSTRSQRLKEVYKLVVTKPAEAGVEADDVEVDNILFELGSKAVYGQILNGEPRIDDRGTHTMRPVEIHSSMLPRTHDPALFMRGEMQTLMVTTLDTESDEQIIGALQDEYCDRFILHYNMPPFATDETGRVGNLKRREVGHGRLAKCALIPVLSRDDEFIYTIHLVLRITESNGSSLMAPMCGGSLALINVGVPLKAHVVGVAMDLILKDNKLAVLADILGDEDHLGDMDLKVTGTDAGTTALRTDIKVQGITKGIMQVALVQAKEGHLYILDRMQAVIGDARTELSEHVPHMIIVKINPKKIRDVIGKGDSVIQVPTKEADCTVDIQGDGTITIASTSSEGMAEAKRRIEGIMAGAGVDKIYSGIVPRLLDFGTTVNILPGKGGLLYISEIANERVNQVSDYMKGDQVVHMKLLSVDEKDRMHLPVEAARVEGDDMPAAALQASDAGDVISQQQQQQQQ